MSVQAKAQRLLCEGRVSPDSAPAHVYRVEGDHGTYIVVVGPHVALCSCPSASRCSHIEAAVEWEWADEATRVLLQRAVGHRRAEQSAEAEAVFARLA